MVAVRRMSNVQTGKVLGLFISTKLSSEREPRESIELEAPGVVGDKFYGKDTERSILITSIYSYDLVKGYDIEMPFGYLGENILIDYNPYELPIGTQLRIGEAVLQISQNCTICNHLSVLDKRIPKLLRKERGIFAKVVKPASICKDDKIYLS